MIKAILIISITVLSLTTIPRLQGYAFAADNANVEDRFIGSTFKTLARAFVAVADLKQIKKTNINRLNKMSDAKFAKKYSKLYTKMPDLPVKLKATYGIAEHMTRQQAIRNFESLDKKKLYEAIDMVPDAIITAAFKKYVGEEKQALQKSSVATQINNIWNKMIEKVYNTQAKG